MIALYSLHFSSNIFVIFLFAYIFLPPYLPFFYAPKNAKCLHNFVADTTFLLSSQLLLYDSLLATYYVQKRSSPFDQLFAYLA